MHTYIHFLLYLLLRTIQTFSAPTNLDLAAYFVTLYSNASGQVSAEAIVNGLTLLSIIVIFGVPYFKQIQGKMFLDLDRRIKRDC